MPNRQAFENILGHSFIIPAMTSGQTTLIPPSYSGWPVAPSQFVLSIEAEIISVTVSAGPTWTIARGQEGSAAASHAAGKIAYARLTAGALDRIVGVSEAGVLKSTTRDLDFASGATVTDVGGVATVAITGGAIGAGNQAITGDLDVSGALTVHGATDLEDTLYVAGSGTFHTTLDVQGTLTAEGLLSADHVASAHDVVGFGVTSGNELHAWSDGVVTDNESGLLGSIASGPPSSSGIPAGVLVVGRDGSVWVCTASGSPDTWAMAGTGGASDMVASGGSHAHGLAPDPGASAGTTKFLREDATWQVPAGGGGGSSLDYILIQDQKSASTGGGTFTSGAWRTRDLQTIVSDSGSHASLSSNQITLAAGTYRFAAKVPAAYVQRHQARLYNITDSAVLAIGTTESTDNGTGTLTTTSSMIFGRFTIGASKALEVQHQCGVTRANEGFGNFGSFGTEVYTSIEFWKE